MKKVFNLLLTILLLIPILVNASSFNSATGIASRYINNFLNPNRYIKMNSGDLISKEEVERTIVRPGMTVSSYMYDGTKFWAKNKYIIGEEIEMYAEGDVKTKVTEIVLHDTKVKGTGKFTDPWIFVDTYKVTVFTSANGTIDGQQSVTKNVDSNGNVSFTIEPNSGYKYLNNNCGATSEVIGNILTIKNVEKDITCGVTFEASKYSNTLPVPYKVVHINLTNSDVTYRFDNPSPSPNTFSAVYLNGYYTDDTLKTRIGKLTNIPSRKGWTFNGYYVKRSNYSKLDEITSTDELLINNKGFFETTYGLLKDNTTKEVIGFSIEPNKYKITFNIEGGTGGTPYVENWPYEHDMPEIDIPGRPGYTFDGYYTKANGEGDKYYNTNGKASRIFNPNTPGNLTLYANWKECGKGNYCPGDNVAYSCPTGFEDTATTTSTKCAECRYWSRCARGEYTCIPGCDQTCYNQKYCSWSACTNTGCTWNGSQCVTAGNCSCAAYYTVKYCYDTNCSACHSGEDKCEADWVYNTTCTSNSAQYTVKLDKQGGTGGIDSYTIKYVDDIPTASTSNTISIPTREGYYFDGYYTMKEGKGTKIIGAFYKYSSSYSNTKTYTHNELNELITSVEGSIITNDLKEKATLNGTTYTLYANWIKCPRGSKCPGNNKYYYCEGGTYQPEEGQKECINCVAKSYSEMKGNGPSSDGTTEEMVGLTECIACNNGKTNTSNGSSLCNTNCSNNANVKEWETAVWNSNNTVSNNCKVKSCNSGYHISNNKCVRNTVTIKYRLGSGETIQAQTSSSSGTTYRWTTDSNRYIYLNGSMYIQTINYGESLDSSGLANYNNSTYMNISKPGYTGVSNAEWVNLNNTSKKYNQATAYAASDFCDASSGNCEVTLGVNWSASSIKNVLPALTSKDCVNMNRYQGSSANNFICFGTSDKDTCINNKNKYMYRIIGFDNNYIKVIKQVPLDEQRQYHSSNMHAAWAGECKAGVNNTTCTLYTGLNNNYFLNNTKYVPSGWKNTIETHTWKYRCEGINYGDVYVNSNGGWCSRRATSECPNHIWQDLQLNCLYEEKATGDGGLASVNAKIGLMNATDLNYSYSGGVLCTDTGCGSSWLSLSSNGYGYDKYNLEQGTQVRMIEWGMGYRGQVSQSLGSNAYSAMGFESKVNIRHESITQEYVSFSYATLTRKFYVRPVFYISTNITYAGGTGSSTNPYMIIPK